MLANRVTQAARKTRDRILERGVLERRDLAAAVAYDVVVVLASRVRRLVAGRRPELDAPHEPRAGQQVERAVDARHAGAAAIVPEQVEDLLRRQAAVLA